MKGAVWTVDDTEFYRRRQQRGTITRSTPTTPKAADNSLNILASAVASSLTNVDLRAATSSPVSEQHQQFDDDEQHLEEIKEEKREHEVEEEEIIKNDEKRTITATVTAQEASTVDSQGLLKMFIKQEEESSPKLVVDEAS